MAQESVDIFTEYDRLERERAQLDGLLLAELRDYMAATSQKDLALLLGYTQAYICDLMHGRRQVNKQLWRRAKSALRS